MRKAVTYFLMVWLVFSCSSDSSNSPDNTSAQNEEMHDTLLQANPVSVKNIQGKNVTLYCEIYQNGKPIIFLTSPQYLSSRFYVPFLLPLFPNHQCIFIDYRGAGRSSFPADSSFTFKDYLADLDSLIKTLPLTDKPIIFAHGFGSLLAIQYAAENSDKIAKLIISNPYPLSAEGYQERVDNIIKSREEKMMMELFQTYKSKEYKNGQKEAVTKVLTLELGQMISPLAKESFLHNVVLQEKEAACFELLKTRSEKPLLHYNFLPLTSKINLPVLLFQSDLDFTSIEHTQEYVNNLSTATFYNIPGSIHYTFIDNPDFVKNKSERFLTNQEL